MLNIAVAALAVTRELGLDPEFERVRASARDQMLKLLTGPVESDYDALRAESDRVARELGAR